MCCHGGVISVHLSAHFSMKILAILPFLLALHMRALAVETFPSSTFAPETREVLKSIAEKYQKLGNWEATFTQETRSVGLGRSTFNEGKFQFASPNKFRYALMQPESSEFLSDGTKAWQISYREGRKKPALVKEFGDVTKLELDRYLFILKGIKALTPEEEKSMSKDFVVSSRKDEKHSILQLESRAPSEIARFEIFFTPRQSAPAKAVLTDALGNTTTITIVRHQKLKKTEAKFFQPEVPPGSKTERISQ